MLGFVLLHEVTQMFQEQKRPQFGLHAAIKQAHENSAFTKFRQTGSAGAALRHSRTASPGLSEVGQGVTKYTTLILGA